MRPKSCGADFEVECNIEVLGAVAPGAEILVYFAPNSNQGFVHAIRQAVTDSQNRPNVISITWGYAEDSWNKQEMATMNQSFQFAASQGITILAASGDRGVTDGLTDGKPHVDFPGSSPWVLTVGGTHVSVSGNKIGSEVVWNDSNGGATGGGISSFFPKPNWQGQTNVVNDSQGHLGRGVPDVAASASPEPGYQIFVGGRTLVIGGGAGATPLWAGLIALINQRTGRNLGYINPILYTKLGPEGILRGITEGDNGVGGVRGYSAGPGWNATTGWGVPDGEKLLEAFKSLGSESQ